MENENSNSENNSNNENSNSENNANNENANSENNSAEENSNSENTNNENSNSENQTVPMGTFLKMKKDAAETTKAFKELQDKQKVADDAKLIAEGKLQEVLDETVKERDNLKVKADKYDLNHVAKIAKTKELMGDDWRDDMEDLSDDTLDILISSKNKKDHAIDVDHNNNNNNGDEKIKLNDTQKAKAHEMFSHLPHVDAEKSYASIADKVEIKKKE